MTGNINLSHYLLFFITGLCIGSFLNVVIFRVPNRISIAKGRSECTVCKTQIRNIDLIPVVSYLLLGGKCRSCKAKISLRYPLVELFTGFCFILILFVKGCSFLSIFIAAYASVLIAVAMIDFDTMTIPNGLLITLIPIAAAVCFIDRDVVIVSRVIGFFSISLPMYLLTFLIKDSFGGGDIKLFAISGFILGWENTLLAAFLSVVLGGAAAFFILAIKKQSKRHMPFGPYICIACFIAVLWGNRIIHWYLGLFSI
ncbi:MAG: prepilin peptidase [Christensenellales bacterium]